MIGLSVYTAIAGSLFITLWRYPAVALAGVLCMFGLEQWGQATTTFFAQHQTATNYLIGGILVIALAVQGIKRGFRIFSEYPLIGWLTLALFLYAFISTQWAPRPDISLNLWTGRWPYIVIFIVLSPLLITEDRDLRVAYASLILVGGVLATLLMFFVKWEARRIVLQHDLGNPLSVAAMGGMVMLILILADPWPESKIWFPVKWALVAICLALIVRSGSRGQLLGVLLVSIACWPISRRLIHLKQFAFLAFIILFLGTATNYAFQEFWVQENYGKHAARWSEQSAQDDMSGRLSNALLLVRFWFSSPETVLLGLGNSASYDPRILGFYPHFLPLEILAEEGLIGFGLFIMILYCALRTTFRSLRMVANNREERLLLGGLVGLCLFTLILSFKQGSLLTNLEPFMLAVVLGRYERIVLWSRAAEMPENEESEDTPTSFSKQSTMWGKPIELGPRLTR